MRAVRTRAGPACGKLHVMSSTATVPTDGLTDEQRAFTAAIREFARREAGTREQRDALTHHGRHPHNPELYAKVAELGWLGVAIGEQWGGSGAASSTSACSSRRPRAGCCRSARSA